MILFWTIYLITGLLSTYLFCYWFLKCIRTNSFEEFKKEKISFKECIKLMFYSPDWNKTESVVEPSPIPFIFVAFGPLMGIIVFFSFLYIFIVKDKAFGKTNSMGP